MSPAPRRSIAFSFSFGSSGSNWTNLDWYVLSGSATTTLSAVKDCPDLVTT